MITYIARNCLTQPENEVKILGFSTLKLSTKSTMLTMIDDKMETRSQKWKQAWN